MALAPAERIKKSLQAYRAAPGSVDAAI